MEIKVFNNNVEKALKVAKKKLAGEGLFRELKRRRFYEKPSVRKKAKQREAQRRRQKWLSKRRPEYTLRSSASPSFIILPIRLLVMREDQIHAAIKILRREVRQWQEPVVGVVARESARDPFRILISCLLSLRTKDKTTSEASARLFALAHTPAGLLALSPRKIERAIYPVGFYRTKAKAIHAICRRLLDVYDGKVPRTIDELVMLPGVGRKTANLVVTVGYQRP